MSRQVTFEVHVSQKNRWEIHARHEDAGAAIEEAKTLDILPSVDEVKVVRDTYDEDVGESVETILYRSPKGKIRKAALINSSKPRRRKRPAVDHSELDFSLFGTPEKSKRRGRKNKPKSFTGTLVKILLIVLFGVTISGFLAFGSVVFLRDTSFSSNAQTNIVFIIFIVAFLLSTFVMALNFLKKENIVGPARPIRRAGSPPPQDVKRTTKPTAAPGTSPFEAGIPGAPPSVEALKSTADQPDATAPPVTVVEPPTVKEPEAPELPSQDLPTVPDEALQEPSDEPDTVTETVEQSHLPPHAEQQRLSLMKFLGDSLEKMQADTSKIDSFNKFGINLYLAGAIEALGQKTMLDIRSASTILSETVSIIGFKKPEAIKFANKYEDYLLADSRYMQMFQAGRNAMNMNLDDDPDAVQYLEQALAEWNQPKPKDENTGPVTVLFTDIAGSTAMTQELGDAVAQQIVRAHNRVVREALTDFSGKEIKHTGDGIMASFSAVSNGVEAAIRMQQSIVTHNQHNPDLPLHIKIGINAGEPIAEDNDLFGSTVQMAARIVDKAGKGEIFVSQIVRGICEGKKLQFRDRGQYEMKGFDQPPTLFEVLWNKD